jgi:Flp pilus assembly protein TadD
MSFPKMFLRKRRRVVLACFALLLVSFAPGCSSKSKKDEMPAPVTENDSQPGEGAMKAPEENNSAEPTKGSSHRADVPGASAIRKDVSLDPKYKPLGQALRAGAQGKPGSVQDEASKILGVNPSDPVALNALALVQLKRGKPGAAKLLIQRALEKNPGAESAALRNNFGVALLDDRDGAIAQFKKALKLDDRHAEALGNLGSIYAQSGDFSKALPLLEGSYKQNRNNLAVANNYALALRAANDLEGARKVYDGILQTNSKDVNATLNYAILLIDYMNKPKDGLDLVYKVKFLETQRKDVLSRANALEKKAKSELK